MPISIFSTNVNYYKNGIFWWQKVINRIIGEKNYEFIRMEKRILGAKIYYARQQFLYQINVTYPDIACALGTYSKFDASSGFPNPIPYETFRDFQENTPNSEGWFAMMVAIICGIFTIFTIYCYLLPYYTANNYYLHGHEKRHRIKDYYATAVYEELVGNSNSEIIWTPHYFQQARERLMLGYCNPDDIRRVFMTSYNRPHKYKDHYFNNKYYKSNDMRKAGYQFNYNQIYI